MLVKIPPHVIQNCLGIAIFTTFRTGLHISGAGGSGVVLARLPDGTWSPPSGFLVHTLGAGLMVGLDIYDSVRQRLVSHHFTFGDGRDARLFRVAQRYVWPAELDLMARIAGLTLSERWEDWRRSPFTAESTSHISVWVKPQG